MNTPAAEPDGVVVENLSLSFGATEVLKGVNLRIRQGEFFAFLGPSGSGKSTLLRAIAGFGPTPTGRILIQGADVATLPPWKRDVGMVFQSYALWPHLSVRANVAFGLEERRLPRREIDERVDRALDMVGLRALAERRPSQLSGGQQQRVALARTVVIEPKVLLLDEPLSNLDANLRVHMRRDIRALQRKLRLTTIFVTHDQEEANTTSDRMAVLDQGVIQQVGTPMALYDRPDNLFVANFLGSANIIRGVASAEGAGVRFRGNGGFEMMLPAGKTGQCAIMFRPQNVAIRAAGADLSDTRVRMRGTIDQVEFHGSIVRYGARVGDALVLVDHVHRQGEAAFAVAAAVDLLVDRDSVQSLADQEAVPNETA